jgi:predicted DNA-binding protein
MDTKEVVVSVRMSAEMLVWLDSLAKSEGRSRSNLVQRILEQEKERGVRIEMTANNAAPNSAIHSASETSQYTLQSKLLRRRLLR